MKLLFFYGLGLALAWGGLISLIAGLEAWPRDGALVPAAAGAALLVSAARALLVFVRLYRPFARNGGQTFR